MLGICKVQLVILYKFRNLMFFFNHIVLLNLCNNYIIYVLKTRILTPILFFLLTILSFSVVAQASIYDIEFLSTSNGLSQGSVYFMLKDSRGFMWFSSYEGLNRYDGKQFKYYKNGSNSKKSIRGTIIYGLAEDAHGDLWIGTEEGLNCLNRQTEEITFFPAEGNQLQQVHSFYADSTKIWYVGSKEGLVCFDFIQKQKQFVIPHIKQKDTYFQTFEAIHTSKNEIWLPTSTNQTGLTRYNINTKKVDYFFSDDSHNSFGETLQVYSFCYDNEDDAIWVAHKEGLIYFQPKSLTIKKYNSKKIDFKKSYIYNLRKDNHNQLWLATENDGVVVFSPENKEFKKLSELQSLNKFNLNEDLVASIFIDKEKDIIWANYEPQGIMKITPSKKLFNNDLISLRLKSGIKSSVRCFTSIKESVLWAGTLGDGIYAIDFSKNELKKIKASRYLPSDNIFQLLKDKYNQVWVGTLSGLCQIDIKTQKLSTFLNKNSNNPQSCNIVRDIIQISKNEIALATEDGVAFFDVLSKKISTQKLLQGKVISKIYLDSINNQLYVAPFNEGFYVFDNSNYSLVKRSFDTHTILHFLMHHYNLYVSTNKGLWKLNITNDERKYYTVEEGLPSNTVYNAMCYNDSILWLATNYGLSKFNILNETFTNYTAQHGLNSFEYNTNGYFKKLDGTFFLGGVNGIDKFRPEDLTVTPYYFPTKLIDIKVNNQSLVLDSVISEKQSITLNYNENNIQVAFQALDYLNNGTFHYRYKLTPFQTNWIYTQNNIVDFVQLPEGNYMFIVQSTTAHGIWNGSQALIHITIKPPFWKTNWFYAMAILALITLIAYFFNIVLQKRLALQRIEFEKRQVLEQERIRISRDMHDDLGSGLSVIHLLSKYIKKDNFDEVTKMRIDKIVESSTILLERLKEIIWTIHPDNEQIESLSEYLKTYIYELNELHPIQISFSSNVAGKTHPLSKNVQYNLLVCVKEAITNALKYAEASHIELLFDANAHSLSITIRDNGVGFDIDEKKKNGGNGIKNILQRMNSINGKAQILSNNGGTIVILSYEITY